MNTSCPTIPISKYPAERCFFPYVERLGMFLWRESISHFQSDSSCHLQSENPPNDPPKVYEHNFPGSRVTRRSIEHLAAQDLDDAADIWLLRCGSDHADWLFSKVFTTPVHLQ